MKAPSMAGRRAGRDAGGRSGGRKPGRLRLVLVAVAAVVAGTMTSGEMAHAATQTVDESRAAATRQLVAGVLKYNPGSKQVGPASVELQPGVVMTVHPRLAAAPRSVTPSVSVSLCSLRHSDPNGWLCLYQDANWGGANLDLYYCGNVNLSTRYMPDGRPWNDQISSIDNDQSSGVVSDFYNYTGSGDPNSSANWKLVLSLPAGHYLRDLSKDNSAEGHGIKANDRIDIVHVC